MCGVQIMCFPCSTKPMVTLALPSLYGSSIYLSPKHSPCLPNSFSSRKCHNKIKKLIVFAVTKEEEEEDKESVPVWAKPDSDEPPPWARPEASQAQALQVPFYVYLIASSITAIAAIGSVFEYINERPVFGILESDSIFYAPVLGFFVFTGIPTSGFLWFKSVEAANKEAEEQDRRDGFL